MNILQSSRIGSTMLVIFSCILPANATPTVTGHTSDFKHGSTARITGSGFGVKSPAKPYLWAPFDGSAQPSNLGVVTNWSLSNMVYGSGQGYSGTGGLVSSGKEPWTAKVNASGFAWNDYGQKMFLFRRVRRNFDITSDMNWKTIRVWADHSKTGTNYPNWYLATSNNRLYVEGIKAGSWVPGGGRGSANAWRTDEFVIQANSSASVADGIFLYTVDSEVVESLPRPGTSPSDVKDRWKMKDNSSSGSAPMTEFYPVHGVMAVVTVPSHYRYWVDDVYIDTTWARVVVGNHPTLEDSTHREIQIPRTWSSSSIEVLVNLQSFPDDEPRYLFVVDLDGNASPGYRLDSKPLDSKPLPKPSSVTVEQEG